MVRAYERLQFLIQEEERIVSRCLFRTANGLEQRIGAREKLLQKSATFLESQNDDLGQLCASLKELSTQAESKRDKMFPSSDRAGLLQQISAALEADDQLDELDRLTRIRCPRTASWIFDQAIFKAFINGECNILWIQGSPGGGKSVLSAAIIEYLKSGMNNAPLTAMGFCHTDNVGRPSLDAVLSLVLQLVGKAKNSLYAFPRLWLKVST